MNEMPPEADRPEELDELYRRISARDPSRPSEPLRRAVLAHAAQLAGGAVPQPAAGNPQRRRGARCGGPWRSGPLPPLHSAHS